MRPFILAIMAFAMLGCLGGAPGDNQTNRTGCVCTAEYNPVCGSDNMTYGNPCMAACVNATVMHPGKCQVAGGCSDSDSGKDVLAKGTVVVGNGSFADSCSGNASVTEYYCDGGEAANQSIACPAGYSCREGACVAGAAAPPPGPACTDSDNGTDFSVAGTVSVDGSVYNDVCTDLKLVKEYYCENGGMKNTIHMCDPGMRCEDGKCVVPEQRCVDTDSGDDIYTRGTVNAGTIISSTVSTDSCADNSSVREYYCDGNRSASRIESCPSRFSCVNGACSLVLCNDTDGGQSPNVLGTATDSGGSHTDFCASASSVGEYYCSGGVAQSATLDCQGGRICSGGSCAFQCTDSDGGNDTMTVGTVSVGTANYTDSCASASAVKEYYCNGNSAASSSIECGVGYGCDAGKCVLSPSPCNDTDGGDSPTVRGTASTDFVSKTDYCIDSGTLREYYCPGPTGNPVSRDYNCTLSACSAGACSP